MCTPCPPHEGWALVQGGHTLISDKVSPIFQQNRLSLCNSASHVLRDICFSGKQTGTGLWQIKDLVKTLEPYCFRRYSSQLFENDQGGLWRLLWEVHLEEAVHQPCQIQIMLEDQSEKQAEGRTGNRNPGSKKSPAGRWTLFTLICDARSRNLRLLPSGVSYSNFIPVLCPIC